MRDTAPDPARGPSPAHAGHDELLVAAHAAGDASGRELGRAAALVASCPECARLHRDLRALASALASAPAPARPRDFGITAAQAAELRRPRGWRRALAPLAGARSAAGPLAASLAALGLAGLLVGGGARLPLGGAASAPSWGEMGTKSTSAPIAAAGDQTPSDAASGAFGGPSTAAASSPSLPTPPGASPSTNDLPTPTPAGPSATPQRPASSQTTPISRADAEAIARAARPAYAKETILDVRLGTFAQLRETFAPNDGPYPAGDALVWRINLGWVLGPLDGQGVFVVIDATDGHVIQIVDWIS